MSRRITAVSRMALLLVSYLVVGNVGCLLGCVEKKPMEGADSATAGEDCDASSVGPMDIAVDEGDESTVWVDHVSGEHVVGFDEGLASDLKELEEVPQCNQSSELSLGSAPSDGFNFGAVLTGQAYERVVVATNLSKEIITIQSVRLESSVFALVEPPRTPFDMESCDSLSLTVRLPDEGPVSVILRTDVVVTFGRKGAADNETQQLHIGVSASRVEPEMVTCNFSLAHVPGDLSVGSCNTDEFIYANRGTGRCDVARIGVADCTVGQDGEIECPGPNEASASSFFRFVATGLQVSEFSVTPGEVRQLRIGSSGTAPASLPHYATVFIVAKEHLTGRVSNFPTPEILEDGTTGYRWLIRLVE